MPTEHTCLPKAWLSSPTCAGKSFFWMKASGEMDWTVLGSGWVPALAGMRGILLQPQLASRAAARTLQQLNTSPEECRTNFYITPAHSESLGWEQNQAWALCIK